METVNIHASLTRLQFCSYPTYEEWKLFTNFVYIVSKIERSYPTYEEWKQDDLKQILTFAKQVLILPMRNGNLAVSLCYSHMVVYVLILPMRNGNLLLFEFLI